MENGVFFLINFYLYWLGFGITPILLVCESDIPS